MKELKLDLSESIKRLDVFTKYLVTTRVMGNYRSVFKGRGLEFEGYADYKSGDDSRLIDWKSTKKANKLLIKKFREERNLDVFFLIDASSTMVYSSIKKLKNEYAAEFVASLAYVMLNAGDSVGYALFSDGIIKKEPPARKKHQFYALLKSLVNPLLYGGGYNLEGALRFTMEFLEEGSLLIIVSDFIGLKEEWQKYLKTAGGKFDVIGVMINDPTDIVLPEDEHQVMLEDPMGGKQLLIVPNHIRARYGEYVEIQRRLVKDVFLKTNCDFMELSTDMPFIKEIIKFFKKREKRLSR